jgi:hypothetical protein
MRFAARSQIISRPALVDRLAGDGSPLTSPGSERTVADYLLAEALATVGSAQD